MSKVYSDPTAPLHGLLDDNMTVATGGFGLCGIPENLTARCATAAGRLDAVGDRE